MTGGLSEPGRMAEEIFSRKGYLDYTKQMLSIPENPPQKVPMLGQHLWLYKSGFYKEVEPIELVGW